MIQFPVGKNLQMFLFTLSDLWQLVERFSKVYLGVWLGFCHVCVRFCGRSLEQTGVSPALVHRLQIILVYLPLFFRFKVSQALGNRSNKTNVYIEAASLNNYSTMEAFCSF